MSAFLTKVDGERIAIPHRLESRVFFEPGLRSDRTRIGVRRSFMNGLAAAIPRPLLIDRSQITVILEREILAPDGRVVGVVVELYDAEERIAGLVLSLDDVG
jgi:hypothetical protein